MRFELGVTDLKLELQTKKGDVIIDASTTLTSEQSGAILSKLNETDKKIIGEKDPIKVAEMIAGQLSEIYANKEVGSDKPKWWIQNTSNEMMLQIKNWTIMQLLGVKKNALS